MSTNCVFGSYFLICIQKLALTNFCVGLGATSVNPLGFTYIFCHIDDAAEIKSLVSAMSKIKGILREVDIKDCKDTWRPWSTRDQGGEKG